jgi:hypothetical protein
MALLFLVHFSKRQLLLGLFMVTGYAIVLALLIPFSYTHRKPTNSIFSAVFILSSNKNPAGCYIKNEDVLIASGGHIALRLCLVCAK